MSAADGRSAPIGAADINRRLATERLRRGRGLDRAADRRTWSAPIDSLPAGTVVLASELRRPHLLTVDRLLRFGFDGWHTPVDRPRRGAIEVLTPPTSVAALRHGFQPVLDASVSEASADDVGPRATPTGESDPGCTP